MSNQINKMLTDLLGKMDEKVLQAKINAAMDMLKNGETDELVKKLNKMDKNELMTKINEFDESKLKNLNIDKEEIRKRVNDADLEQLKKLIGENGDEIVNKLKDFMK